MAITNLTLSCNSFNYQNVITFNYSGVGTKANVYVSYGSDYTLFKTIYPLNASGNQANDTDIVNLCTETATYRIDIYDASNTVIETQSVSCANTCLPEQPNANFTVNCNSRTNKGFDLTLSAYAGNSNLANYILLRIYRSTLDPSTISLPNNAYTLIATLPSSTTTYTDSTASANTQYWYVAEYYNSLNGQVAKRQSGPCTTLNNSCGNNLPLTDFEINTSQSTDTHLIISDLFNDDGSIRIPDQYLCNNIASVSSIKLKYWDACYGSESASTENVLSVTSKYFVPLTRTINIALTEGVYNLKFTIQYVDNFGKTKTITQSQCVFIDGDLKCNIAKFIANDVNNTILTSVYYGLDFLADCDLCASACEVYQYLKNYGNTCC